MTENPEVEQSKAVTPVYEPRILSWLSRLEITLAAIFLFTMFVGVLWQVVGRYVHVLNWAGAGEIARYSLVGLTFIMVGYLIGKNGQVTVEVIDNIVKGRRGTVAVRFVAAILLSAICAIMLLEAWTLFSTGFSRTTTVLQIPLGYMFLFPLLGFFSGTVRAIVKIFTANRIEKDALTFDEVEA